MIRWRMLRYSDIPLWVVVSALLCIGFSALFSITYGTQTRYGGEAWSIILKHILTLGVAIIGGAIFAYIDYRKFAVIAWVGYAFSLILLLLLPVAGRGGGALRWLSVGPFFLQPSELIKICLVGCLAHFISSKEGKLENGWDLAILALIALPPFYLIFRQPDLGTASILLMVTFGMVFWANSTLAIRLFLILPMLSALLHFHWIVWIIYILVSTLLLLGMRLRTAEQWGFVGLNFSVGFLLPWVWQMLKGYQQKRILTFLNPGIDPRGAGYQAWQSLIAIGSGGLLGRGFLHGTQTQLSFVPEQATDFVFSAVAEEWGLIGATLLLTLFVVLIVRVIKIALEAPDSFGLALAGGLAILVGVNVMVNLAMSMGLFPVVGVPLPFVSLGGSSLLLHAIAIGILQSIAMRSSQIFF